MSALSMHCEAAKLVGVCASTDEWAHVRVFSPGPIYNPCTECVEPHRPNFVFSTQERFGAPNDTSTSFRTAAVEQEVHLSTCRRSPCCVIGGVPNATSMPFPYNRINVWNSGTMRTRFCAFKGKLHNEPNASAESPCGAERSGRGPILSHDRGLSMDASAFVQVAARGREKWLSRRRNRPSTSPSPYGTPFSSGQGRCTPAALRTIVLADDDAVDSPKLSTPSESRSPSPTRIATRPSTALRISRISELRSPGTTSHSRSLTPCKYPYDLSQQGVTVDANDDGYHSPTFKAAVLAQLRASKRPGTPSQGVHWQTATPSYDVPVGAGVRNVTTS